MHKIKVYFVAKDLSGIWAAFALFLELIWQSMPSAL
jgi:hypothetical protein